MRLRRVQFNSIKLGQFWRQVLSYASKLTTLDLSGLDLSVPLYLETDENI
jgi:hypothetical protein